MDRRLLCIAVLLGACRDKEAATVTDTGEVPLCSVDAVPEEAALRTGWQEDGSYISPGGRLVAPAGAYLALEQKALEVVVHPTANLAYISHAPSGRDVSVLDLDKLALLQTVDRSNNNNGMRISPGGDALYISAGADGAVEFYDIGKDGLLTLSASVSVPGITAGLEISPDGGTLWAGTYYGDTVSEIDVAKQSVTRSFPISTGSWDIRYVPGREELYVSDLVGEEISVIDLDAAEEVATISAATSPAGLAVSSDGATVYAAVSNGDTVVAIDTASRSIAAEAALTEGELLDEGGMPLRNSNINSLWLDEATGRLYASRGADNAVTVLDAGSMERLGAFPVSMYPTDLEVTPTGELVVVAFKGGEAFTEGSVTLVDVDGLDLSATSAEVSELYASPLERFPLECDDFFPVPTRDSAHASPIEHVVLVVKENKTFDCLFGDMGDEIPELTADPKHQRWTAELTPNQRALMKGFSVSDNFYVNTEESDSGHVMLTSTHMTHYIEWMWMETRRNDYTQGWPIADAGTPSVGSFFTHLLNHGRSLTIYGEIVGLGQQADNGDYIVDYADPEYPGGLAVNYLFTDQSKAEHIAEQIEKEGLTDFTYVLFPNDHTAGTSEGYPTPESMVADNDYAVGVLVDAISGDPELWEKTAIIVLQDDPQGCSDSVDEMRSLLLVISPWAKRGYVSHANADYLSVFATIERILDVPPLGRPDAVASPLWDMFQPEADLTAFKAIPREYPEEQNKRGAFGQDLSERLDFSGPDRSAELTPLLQAYRLWKMGRISREEAEARLVAPRMALDEEWWEELEEEAEEESFAYDRAWAFYEQWARDNGHTIPPNTPASQRQ